MATSRLAWSGLKSSSHRDAIPLDFEDDQQRKQPADVAPRTRCSKARWALTGEYRAWAVVIQEGGIATAFVPKSLDHANCSE